MQLNSIEPVEEEEDDTDKHYRKKAEIDLQRRLTSINKIKPMLSTFE
jgi:hypothetical protein